MPTGRLANIAQVATLMDSRTAFHSSGVRSGQPIDQCKPLNSRRRARGKRTLVSRTIPWPSPTASTSGKRRRRHLSKRPSARPDRRSADACLPGKCRAPSRPVRRSHRSGRRCRARPRRVDTSFSAARTFSACATFASTAAQTPSASSAALPYLPAGTALTSPMASLLSPIRLDQVEVRRDLDIGLGVRGRDKHERDCRAASPRCPA